MATRSTIALQYANGQVHQVYCHWDGYLDNNGQLLRDNWSDPFKLQKLMDLGDLSSLGPDVGEKHEFSCPFAYGSAEYNAWQEETRKGCTFYGRDRGESETKARLFADLTEYMKEGQQEEYDYVLTPDRGWLVRCYATNGDWVALDKAFEMEKECAE